MHDGEINSGAVLLVKEKRRNTEEKKNKGVGEEGQRQLFCGHLSLSLTDLCEAQRQLQRR